MGSDKKQLKRAQRAKTKARRGRVSRNRMASGVLDEDRMDLLAEVSRFMLIQMAEAEAISFVEMLTTTITLTSEAGSLDQQIDAQIMILTIYGKSIEGRKSDWMEEATFLDGYAEAARRLGREELIAAWNDAFDF